MQIKKSFSTLLNPHIPLSEVYSFANSNWNKTIVLVDLKITNQAMLLFLKYEIRPDVAKIDMPVQNTGSDAIIIFPREIFLQCDDKSKDTLLKLR